MPSKKKPMFYVYSCNSDMMVIVYVSDKGSDVIDKISVFNPDMAYDYSKNNNLGILDFLYDYIHLSKDNFNEQRQLLLSKLKEDEGFKFHDVFVLGEYHEFPQYD